MPTLLFRVPEPSTESVFESSSWSAPSLRGGMPHDGTITCCGDTRRAALGGLPLACAYSSLPGTGLNLMPRNATPTGATVETSMTIAVQMTLVEVAAIAVVP